MFEITAQRRVLKVQNGTPQLEGLQGYLVLQRLTSSCGRAKRWLNRLEEDASGLTFEEWDPTQDADVSQPPVAMLINSLKLRVACFTLSEAIPPALEAAAHGGRRRYGAGLH